MEKDETDDESDGGEDEILIARWLIIQVCCDLECSWLKSTIATQEDSDEEQAAEGSEALEADGLQNGVGLPIRKSSIGHPGPGD